MAVVLAKVQAGRQTFGLLFHNNAVLVAAPELTFMIGWNGHKVKEYADGQGWKVERSAHEFTLVSGPPVRRAPSEL